MFYLPVPVDEKAVTDRECDSSSGETGLRILIKGGWKDLYVGNLREDKRRGSSKGGEATREGSSRKDGEAR